MAYEKLYNEIYAIVALKYLWRGYRPGFVKSESPDWLNREAGIGVEVSQALMPRDGQEDHFLESWLGKPAEEIPAEAKERYAGRLYFYNGRLWALTDDGEDSRSYVEKCLYRFSRKLEKLNRNFSVWPTNALYLYAHTQAGSLGEVRSIAREMAARQREQRHRFQLVFLDCESSIYVLELNRGKVTEIPVGEKAKEFLEQRAEALRHSDSHDNDSEF